jgi:hypothetical protein
MDLARRQRLSARPLTPASSQLPGAEGRLMDLSIVGSAPNDKPADLKRYV